MIGLTSLPFILLVGTIFSSKNRSKFFQGEQTQSDPSVRGKSFIFITPYGHCENYDGVPEFPGGHTDVPDELALSLFQQTDIPPVSPKFTWSYPVNFYVMAPRNQNRVGNYWTSIQDFPTPKYVSYYLQPDLTLSTQTPVASSSSHSYVYNPVKPVPTVGGNNLFTSCGPADQTSVLKRTDVVAFLSSPLASDLVVTGRMSATLWVSGSTQDTDFTVKVMDRYPSGESTLLQDGIIRMKWRDSTSTPSPMQTGQIYQVQLDLWSTSYVFPSGHSIQVAVSSSNSPRFLAHINQYAPLSDWSNYKPVNATNVIWHDKQHPSFISLPIVSLSDLPRNSNISSV